MPRVRLGKMLLATLVGFLVVGTWTMRNFTLHGRFVLVESNVGYNLYVGNSPDTPIPFGWKNSTRLNRMSGTGNWSMDARKVSAMRC